MHDVTAAFAASFALIMLPSVADADAENTDLVLSSGSAWYEALAVPQADTLAALLADDAEIVLNDLGITQTRAEFLESLDDWADAIEGGAIRFAVRERSERDATFAVCYVFTGSELLTREVVSFRPNGQIAKSVQDSIGDDCGDL